MVFNYGRFPFFFFSLPFFRRWERINEEGGGEFLNFSKCLSKEISQRLETEKVVAGSNFLKNKERISRYAVLRHSILFRL